MAWRQQSPYSLLVFAAMGTGTAPPASDVIDPDKTMVFIRGNTERHDQHFCAADESGRRYALLMCARDSDYVKEKYGGYRGVFATAFGEQADRWDKYMVIDGNFPRRQDLELYDGYVISGSPSDAHGDEPWVLELCALVRDLFFRVRKRVLGVCFGHQVICRALGGEVRRARQGWDIGVTNVQVAPPKSRDDKTQCWFLEELSQGSSTPRPRSSPILEVHQDEVREVPPGAEVIARSDRTGVEMFHFGGRVLGIQGHPEYSKDILDEIINRLVRNGVIQGALADEAKKRLAAGEPDRQFWLRVCRSFLKGPPAMYETREDFVAGATTSISKTSQKDHAYSTMIISQPVPV